MCILWIEFLPYYYLSGKTVSEWKLGGGGNSWSGSKSLTCSQEASGLDSEPLESLKGSCLPLGSGILDLDGVKISFLLGLAPDPEPCEDVVDTLCGVRKGIESASRSIEEDLGFEGV